MGRTAKAVNDKPGVKRTRGRPRVKDLKSQPSIKRQRRSLGSTNHKKRTRDRSSSPTQQEPPELEAMSADEDDDANVSLALASLISIDDHLRPGKCILICPLSNCRKRFSNPIELVSHLRIYHSSEPFPSLKIFACPLCLPKHSSSHSTSSDLNLLSEHTVRYHGKTYSQNEFVYFCTIVVDILNGAKAPDKSSDNIVCKKDAVCTQFQSPPESPYHPILPLVPNLATPKNSIARTIEIASSAVLPISPPTIPTSASAVVTAASAYSPSTFAPPTLPPLSKVTTTTATRVTTDSLGLRLSVIPSPTSYPVATVATPPQPPPPQIIQLASMPQRTPPQQPVLSPSRSIFAALAAAAAAVAGQQPQQHHHSQPPPPPTLLLSSAADPHNILASLGGGGVMTTSGQLPVLISSSTTNVATVPQHQEVLTTAISSSPAISDINALNKQLSPSLKTSSAAAANTAAAITTLQQLIQTATANRVNTSAIPSPIQTPFSSLLHHHHQHVQPAPVSKVPLLTHLTQPPQSSNIPVPTSMATDPASTASLAVAGLPSVTTTYSFIQRQQQPIPASSTPCLNLNPDLDSKTPPPQPAPCSSSSSSSAVPAADASADLLTLARLSVKHATLDMQQQQLQQQQHRVLLETPHHPHPNHRNRRLLPRSPSLYTGATAPASTAATRKRPSPTVALPPVAAKPQPKAVATTAGTLLESVSTSPHKQPQVQHDQQHNVAGGTDRVLQPGRQQEEAPLMTAALVGPQTRPPPSQSLTTTTRNPPQPTKCRLLQASSYLNLQPRQQQHHPAVAAPLLPTTTTTTTAAPTASLVTRVVPSIRPATFQKILPRPNCVATPSPHAQTPTTTTAAPTSASSTLVGLAPKDHRVASSSSSSSSSIPITAVVKSTIVTVTAIPTIGVATAATSHVNGNIAKMKEESVGGGGGGVSTLVKCTSPSEVNIST